MSRKLNRIVKNNNKGKTKERKNKKRTYDTTYGKRSYAAFFIWLVVFCLVMMAVTLFTDVYTDMANDLITKMLLIITTFAIEVLFYMIKVTEKIYWLNKITYEEAVYMTRDERRRYAGRQLRYVSYGFLATTLYVSVGIIANTPSWLDCMVVGAIMGIVAYTAVNVKIKE